MKSRIILSVGMLLISALSVSAQPASPSADSVDAALKRAAMLRAELQTLDSEMKNLSQRLPAMKAELDAMLKRIENVQIAKEVKTPEQSDNKKETQNVEFRPPLRRESKKATSLGIICQNQKLFILDLDALEKAAKDNQTTVMRTGGMLTLATGDYDVKVAVTQINLGDRTLFLPNMELIMKSGRSGETWSEAAGPSSVFRKFLGGLSPDKSMLQFVVYPDSYDLFRSARAVAWERKFELGWNASQVGDPIRIGSGAGVAQ